MHSQFVVTTISPATSLPVPEQVLLVDDGAAVGCSEHCARSPFDPEFFPDPPDLLSGPRIVWSRQRAEERRSPVIGAALEDFVRLADARPDQIAAYARRWGVLGFNERWTLDLGLAGFLPGDRCDLEVDKGLKGRASARCTRGARLDQLSGVKAEELAQKLADPTWTRPDWFWEPVVMWREYSQGFRSVLHLAGSVGAGKHADLNAISAARRFRRLLIDCEGCGSCDECDGTEDAAFLSVEACRELVLELTNQLLAFGQFYPRLTWDADDGMPSVVMDLSEGEDEEFQDLPPYGFLFPALVSRLCATLASPLGIYQCDACGSPYSPLKRRPRVDRRRYCPPCSLDASLASKREWWRKNRSPASRYKNRHCDALVGHST